MDLQNIPEVELLARCIYGEARGEVQAGKIAVGHVVLNRVKEGGWFGHTIRQVILKPKQFSCFNRGDPNYKLLKQDKISGLDKYRELAGSLIFGAIPDNTNGATYYHAVSIDPYWIKGVIFVKQIGNHKFYRTDKQ